MNLSTVARIPLGTVLTCKNGHRWTCVGATKTKEEEYSYVFIRDITGLHGTRDLKDRMWTKTVATVEGFVNYFPQSEHLFNAG